jgi:ribosomal protein S27AE
VLPLAEKGKTMNSKSQSKMPVERPRLVRPLPTSGEADCPKCHGHGSVARHNADWTCHRCGFHEVTDPDRETEQAAFEDWLESTSPSGDVESVKRQWEASHEFRDLFCLPNSQSSNP